MSTEQAPRSALAGFIAVELAYLAAAHIVGGPPWTVVGMLAFVAPLVTGLRRASLALLLPSLTWLVLFRVTGNRELFFPFTMYVAAYLAVSLAERDARLGVAGGSFVVATFLGIRVLQRATVPVLAVECVVAAAILAAVVAARAMLRKQQATDAMIVAGASLLAYAGLAL
jgi:hypothetical protein